jgi:hypothetical protein
MFIKSANRVDGTFLRSLLHLNMYLFFHFIQQNAINGNKGKKEVSCDQ